MMDELFRKTIMVSIYVPARNSGTNNCPGI